MMSGKLAFANSVAVGALAVSFCTCAAAADLGSRPPVIAPIPAWAGFYIGGHVGGVTSSETVNSMSTDPSGVLGGLQAGYNHMIAPNWLVGIEGELSWTSASGTVDGFKSQHKWYDTLDARLGYVMAGGWLLYAKGGAAWMNQDLSASGPRTPVSESLTRSGWNIGAGAEFMLAPQWSAKAEYDFLDFGKDTSLHFGDVDTRVHEFKVGVNYHFAPGTLFGRW